MKFFKKFKKTKVLIVLSILVILGALFLTKEKELEYSTKVVEIGTIRQIVSETGVVRASSEATLSFARSGRIEKVYFEKGDSVNRGQVIAQLETGSLEAQLNQAEASLERVLVEKTIERAETSFNATKQDVVNILKNTYITADDSIRNKADQAFEDDGTDSPDIIRGGSSYDERKDINDERRDLKYIFRDWEESLIGLNSDSDFTSYIKTASENLLLIRDYLNELAILVNKFKPNEYNLTAAQIDVYQTAVYSARTSINTAISSLNSTVDKYNSEKISLEQSTSGEGELVTLQNIKIKEAQARIDVIKSQISDAIITSPITGVIIDLMYEEGESVGATVPVVSVISSSNFEMVVDIPEDDIENVNVGDTAEIEFDAYDNLIFDAEILSVSESAKVVEGVPSFEVTLQFKEQNEKIKSGLSVDIDIIAEQKENVLVISTRAVVDGPEGQFVRVVDKNDRNSFMEVDIILGIRGEDGVMEVLSGVRNGDQLITFIEDEVLEELNKK